MDGFTPGPRSLRRLTEQEYQNTVQELLELPDVSVDGFGEDESHGVVTVVTSAVDETLLGVYVDLAESLAARGVAAHLDEWLPCDASMDVCVSAFVGELGGRAFRRPLSDDETEQFTAFFQTARMDWDASVAAELFVTALLLSPEFLYHVELGTADSAGEHLELSEHELASALSYFLWESMPDERLMELATSGELSSPATLRAEIERMVDSPKTSAVLINFHRRWLRLTRLTEIDRDAGLFSWWSEDLAISLDDEFDRFVAGVFFDGGTFADLMTSRRTYGDARAAEHYGASAPSASGAIDLDATRSGILTTGAYLASHARPTENDWIHRGLTVRAEVLCDPPSDPPASADLTQNQNDGRRLENRECSFCHLAMDPIGMGFDRFDATGRDTEIDSAGQVRGAESFGMEEDFADVPELSEGLSESDAVVDCYAESWFQFANRRPLVAEEACQTLELTDGFRASGGSLRELLVMIASAEAFRHRSLTEESP